MRNYLLKKLFFFSSRRRHTRSLRDWSSDVCSSDLRWKDSLDILGRNEQVGVIVYGEQFAANQDLGRRWMTAYIRGLREIGRASCRERVYMLGDGIAVNERH